MDRNWLNIYSSEEFQFKEKKIRIALCLNNWKKKIYPKINFYLCLQKANNVNLKNLIFTIFT